jgi:hypothetical protein
VRRRTTWCGDEKKLAFAVVEPGVSYQALFQGQALD